MANTDLQVGDVVGLKSGGPKMTVHKLDDRGGVVCVYFGEGDVLHEHSFYTAALEKVEEHPSTRRFEH